VLLVVVVAVIAGTAVVAALLAGGSSDGRGKNAAAVARWNGAAAAAFTPLATRISVMAQDRDQFSAGGLSLSAYRVELTQAKAVMQSSAAAAGQLPPYPGSPLVDPLYAATASLYLDAVECELGALDVPAGDLRNQVMLIATRLRELADRTFDQGRVLTGQGLTPPGVPKGSDVVLPAEVPAWVSEGLAAGPPLAAPPPPAATYPPVRQGTRPTEASDRWAAAVNALHVTSPAEVAPHLDTSSAGDLGTLAAGLQKDSDVLGSMPDPAVEFGREKSVRQRLAILIEAEACRAAQAGDLAGTAGTLNGLMNIAQALLITAVSLPR